MAIGIYFSPKSMNANRTTHASRSSKRLAGKPAGRLYHACFGTGDKLAVFDVWDSQQSFDSFGKTMMPIIKGIGVDPGEPQVMPIHNIIKG